MDDLILIEPSGEYAKDVWQMKQEILECDADTEDRFAGAMALQSSASAEEFIEVCRLRKDAATCKSTGVDVPSHQYLAVRKSDNRVVGIMDLRHHIDHPILGTWGGHLGYTVRPCERGKGYAKEMLRLDMEKAADLGIKKLLVTCSDTNGASENVIKANGGVYEKTIDADGTNIKRYWIEL